MTSRALYITQYHRQLYTLQAFEQFGALYMHKLDDEHPTDWDSNQIYKSEFRATAGPDEPSRPANIIMSAACLYRECVLI